MPETDAVLRRIAGGLPAYAIELRDKALSLERERDEAREQIQMMLKHDASRLESDSIVGSCDCLTKTPEVKYHKPGCKYRLISERDEARDWQNVKVSKAGETHTLGTLIQLLERERDEALAANFRQATCLHECAASISHDTSFSIDVLPNAVKHVVRERDEAREQLESILSVIPADAPCLHAETGETVADYILDLQKEVGRVHALYFNDKQQLEAMREAIKEAHGAFDEIASGAACLPGYSIAEASTLAQTILAKIQPFIKP